MTGKYAANMLIRLSVVVRYTEAEEKVQTIFTSALFYCSQVKLRILIFCIIF